MWALKNDETRFDQLTIERATIVLTIDRVGLVLATPVRRIDTHQLGISLELNERDANDVTRMRRLEPVRVLVHVEGIAFNRVKALAVAWTPIGDHAAVRVMVVVDVYDVTYSFR